MNKQRLNRLDGIARKLGRFDIWTEDQREALIDNIQSDLQILEQEVKGLRVQETWMN